jgi:7-keto-8-aminopelargonate synthetase-like enzyme
VGKQGMAYTLDHVPGRFVYIEGKKHLFFSGTSYLGIGQNEVFQHRLIENMKKYGTIFSASRNNNIRIDVYEAMESWMALQNKAERSVTVSSGMMAGQLVTKLLEDLPFIYAPEVHPALWKSSAIPTDFSDFADFTAKIGDLIRKVGKPCVVCCNGIDPLTCMPIRFEWVKDLEANHKVFLVIDDSHAIGLVNPNTLESNFSTIQTLCPPNVNLIVTASLAKALGLPAGIIMGDTECIQKVTELLQFVGASPAVPAYLKTFLQLESEYLRLKKILSTTIDAFVTKNSSILHHFNSLANYPVFYFPHERLYQELKTKGQIISCFPYPQASDKPISRIVLSALHEVEDLEELSRSLEEILEME